MRAWVGGKDHYEGLGGKEERTTVRAVRPA